MLFENPEYIGTCRHVKLFKKFVVKFPRLSPWNHFFYPQISRFWLNLYLQRYEVKEIKKYQGKLGIPELIFADPFGFIVIMKRYRNFENYQEFEKLYQELLAETDLPLEFWENDYVIANFAKTDDGKLVKIDLG